MLIFATVLKLYRLEWVLDGFFRCDCSFLKLCPDCSHETESPDASLLLQVKFEEGAPLEDILHNVTFGVDKIPNRLCEACSSHSDTDGVCQLVLGPDILVIHLARFTNMSGSGCSKNNAVIPFNEELDLSRSTKGKFLLKYRLLSVVQHRGTRDQGHYITIARAPSGPWMKLDDMVASPATGTDPFDQRDGDEGDEVPFTPYVLFWAKVDQNEMTELPVKEQTAATSADVDDELQPVQITINGVLQAPSKTHFVEKSKLAKPKQHHQKDENEDGLRSLQISINGIQQPPSAKHSVKKSFSAILSQQDLEEIYTHMSKILTALEMREMGEGQKNELEKAKTLSVNGKVKDGGGKKESPGKKDGKDGKEDEDEEGDRDEKQEKHEDEEEKKGEQQQQDEQEQGEQEGKQQQQQQEKHEEKNQTGKEGHEKVSWNKRQRPDDHSTIDPKLDKFPRRQTSPNKSRSSPNTKPKGDSEVQTPSDGETSKNLKPKRALVGKKRRKKKKRIGVESK